jgi:hypothetical protein
MRNGRREKGHGTKSGIPDRSLILEAENIIQASVKYSNARFF